jgi:hypothetical protein
MKYVCSYCGYVYDEEAGDPKNGIAPGTKWRMFRRTGLPDLRRSQRGFYRAITESRSGATYRSGFFLMSIAKK